MQQIGPVIPSYGIENHGIIGASIVRWNYTTPALYEHAIRANEAVLAGDPLVVRTGDHTGRSPLDKFVVKEPSSETQIWWGTENRPFPPEKFEDLHRRMRRVPCSNMRPRQPLVVVSRPYMPNRNIQFASRLSFASGPESPDVL